MKKIFALSLLIMVLACKKESKENVSGKKDSIEQKSVQNTDTIQVKINKEESLKKINDDLLLSLKDKNYKDISQFIHPEKGIRFSMYAFTSVNEDKHFSKADFIKYQPTKTVFTWGARDGSGDLYKATVNDYLNNWVFVKDFTKSKFSLNEFQGGGNSLNNLKEVYPNTDFTENFVKGTEQYSEMDWNTLRFVFEEFEGIYYLVAVINDRWTI